jgi:DNA excision repair protein ERCC-3
MDKKRSKPVGQNASKLKSSGLVLSTDVEQCVDLRGLHIDEDRKDKPLLLSPQLMIIVEKFNKLYRIAFEFLMSIAEPINRSHYIHEYQITQMSLYTAMVL